jgi:hypothetical protein
MQETNVAQQNAMQTRKGRLHIPDTLSKKSNKLPVKKILKTKKQKHARGSCKW